MPSHFKLKKLKYLTWAMRACIACTLPLTFFLSMLQTQRAFFLFLRKCKVHVRSITLIVSSKWKSALDLPFSQLGLGKGLLLNATSLDYWNPGQPCLSCSSIPSPSVSHSTDHQVILSCSFVCMFPEMNQWIHYMKYAYSIEKAVQTWGEGIWMMAH